MFKIIPELESDGDGGENLVFDVWEETFTGEKAVFDLIAICTSREKAERVVLALEQEGKTHVH